MTIHRNLNKTGVGGNYQAWWTLRTLQQAGWTCTRSGSGTGGIFAESSVFGSVENGDNQTVGVGAGSETLGNGKCWFVMEDPGGNRQFILLRHATATAVYDRYWWMGYSAAGLYTGGNADTYATATDEEDCTSAGTRASIGDMYSNYTVRSVIQTAADDEPSPDGEYGWIQICLIHPASAVLSVTGFDDMRFVATGDLSPLVVINEHSPMAITDVEADNFGYTFCNSVDAPDWRGMSLTMIKSYYNYNKLGRMSEYDQKERFHSVHWQNRAIYGYRGVSRWFRMSPSERDYPNTALSKTILYLDDYAIFGLLDGDTIPLVA